MRSVFVVLGLAVLTTGCAPNTIIANRHQAVIEAWSSGDAVALAREECEQYGRYAHLERLQGGEFWFSCRETEESMAARRSAAMVSTAAMERSVQPVAKSSSQTARPEDVKPEAGTTLSATAVAQSSQMAITPLPRTGPWVQVGAFGTRAAAERYARDVGEAHRAVVAGHNVVVDEKPVAGRTLHVTRIGGFDSAAGAKRACGALKRRGAPCFVDMLP